MTKATLNRTRHTRQELLDMLKLEEAAVAARGFPPSPDAPHRHLQPFRDSITCLNFEHEGAQEPCEQCWLANYVPSGHDPNVMLCHQIPLNEKGETVHSLETGGDDPHRLRQEVLGWIRGEIARLEAESTEP
jgi:hypothetical protein